MKVIEVIKPLMITVEADVDNYTAEADKASDSSKCFLENL